MSCKVPSQLKDRPETSSSPSNQAASQFAPQVLIVADPFRLAPPPGPRDNWDKVPETGSTGSVTAYSYDTDGRLVRMSRDVKGDGSLEQVTTYAYDERNRLEVEVTDYYDDGAIDSTTVYAYDDQNQIVEMTFYLGPEEPSQLSRTFSYVYNAQGLLTEEVRSSTHGTPTWTRLLTYDCP
jgi:hypothetical protein